MEASRFTGAVRQYLAECVLFGLDNIYHPTADGAVKVIFHRSADEADEVRAAYAALTGQTVKLRKRQASDQAIEGNSAA
jgi:hypothetical protein